ncbi:cupin domain-containing protein [Asanoa sp. WMMD1127]|uniref:cupin domain-containing protein n=1 Tax=Asanoa sp. WMMD1127 TaxID=3016107 RepID=UPI0024168A43|nr:cupin domain-containing protein [Asanoa sp. WMMD1127]MDG4820759.1 cupin domain-containing protein [Asanoa sp. WMMD1127]
MTDTTTRPATEVRKVHRTEVAANRRRGGDLRVLLSPKTVGSTSGFFGTLVLQPGEAVTEHYHPYSEEFLYVLSGQLRLRLDGTVLLELGPGDGVLVPITMRHRLENVGDTAAEAVFHLSPLAPRPELGHVDTEDVAVPEAHNPQVGGAP